MDIEDLIYLENLTQEDAIAKAKELDGRILTLKEADYLIMSGLLRQVVWTSAHLEYDGTDGKLTIGGKTIPVKVPAKEGWYKQDEFGLPFGKKSQVKNKEARYLWRIDKNSGLVARYCYRWDDGDRRDVYCDYGGTSRLGVVILKNQKSVAPAQASEKRG
jgi:hypothetical protein